MKIKYTKPSETSFEIELIPNTVNYFVGLNGTGKTVTTSALEYHIREKLKKRGNWATVPATHLLEPYTFEGFDEIADVWHYTSKTRQSHWVDLDMVFESASSISTLHSSEGMVCQSEIVRVFNKRDEENTLFIFDEIDGNLDIRAKQIFFNKVLPQLKGTSIVMSHDMFFFFINNDVRVFDFTTKTYKTYDEYYLENLIKYSKIVK